MAVKGYVIGCVRGNSITTRNQKKKKQDNEDVSYTVLLHHNRTDENISFCYNLVDFILGSICF